MANYEKREKAFLSPFSKLLPCFFLIPFFIAAVYGNDKGMLYTLLLIAMLICGMYLRSIMNRTLFNAAMDLVCLASVFCVPIAMIQRFLLHGHEAVYRASASFLNANYYGMIIEFVVIIALYRMFTNARGRKAYFAVVAANLLGLLLSGCISGFVGMCCAAGVFLLLKGRYKIVAALVCVVLAAAAVLLLFPDLTPRLSRVDASMGERFSIWSTALKGIKLHPFMGSGTMSYGSVYQQFGGVATGHAHNLLLDMLLNYGFAGVAVILFYVITQVRLLLLRFRNNICTNMNILVVSILVAVMVHGLTDVTIFWPQTGLLFLLVFSSTGIQSGFLEKKLVPENALFPRKGEFVRTAYVEN